MGRELRRKNAKAEGNSLKNTQIKEEKIIKNYLVIISTIVIIGCLIYLGSALFITKELKWFDNNEKEEIKKVESSILISSIFKQKEEEYYVYFYDFNSEDVNATSKVMKKVSDVKIYKVDTSSALNSKYVSDKANKEAKKLDELKVTTPSLIKINNEKIIEFFDKDDISKFN